MHHHQGRYPAARLALAVGLVIAGLTASLTGCDLKPHPKAKDCPDFPRTGQIQRTVVESIDVSESAGDEWDELKNQARQLAESQVGGENPPASLQVFAQDNSVMTHAVHTQLVDPIAFDFDTGGNGTQRRDYTNACLDLFEQELDQALGQITPSNGSDPFGGAAYASTIFEEAGTTDNVFGMFGDGYAVNSACNLYHDAALLEPTLHEDLARRCTNGVVPTMTDVAVFQGGVGVRSADAAPSPDADARAVQLIAFYRDAFWPLTGAQQPANVAPRLQFTERTS